MPEVHPSQVVAHVYHEPILVPTNVEDRAIRSQKARGREILAKIVRRTVITALYDPIPGIEWSLRVRVPLSELAQRLPLVGRLSDAARWTTLVV